MVSLMLGGGRETKESEIDLTVGLMIHKKLGDRVKENEPLATLYANDLDKLAAAKERFLNAYTIGNQSEVKPHKFVYGVVTEKGTELF